MVLTKLSIPAPGTNKTIIAAGNPNRLDVLSLENYTPFFF